MPPKRGREKPPKSAKPWPAPPAPPWRKAKKPKSAEKTVEVPHRQRQKAVGKRPWRGEEEARHRQRRRQEEVASLKKKVAGKAATSGERSRQRRPPPRRRQKKAAKKRGRAATAKKGRGEEGDRSCRHEEKAAPKKAAKKAVKKAAPKKAARRPRRRRRTIARPAHAAGSGGSRTAHPEQQHSTANRKRKWPSGSKRKSRATPSSPRGQGQKRHQGRFHPAAPRPRPELPDVIRCTSASSARKCWIGPPGKDQVAAGGNTPCT